MPHRWGLATMIGILGTAAILSVPATHARQTTPAQFVYLRLSPGLPPRDGQTQRQGYRACEAMLSEWNCREFASRTGDPEDGLRRAMATLGTEAWEMVAVIDQTADLSYPKGPTYLFKRPLAK